MTKGVFITVEGGEGAGKTSILHRLEEELKEKGYEIVRTREPGGIQIAEKIRDVILDVRHTEMDYRTEALLYAAARRQHLVEKVIPALNRGAIVLCDRFIDSSLVYQGYARNIGIDEVKKINAFAIDGYMPHLTLLFDVDPEVGLKRIHDDDQREKNRLDNETLQFHHRVREGYLYLQKVEPNRIKLIDANQSFQRVYDAAMGELNRFLEKI